MDIKVRIQEFQGSDSIDIMAEDCEGFSVQQYVEAPDIPKLAEDLANALRACFVALDMDSEQQAEFLCNENLHSYYAG